MINDMSKEAALTYLIFDKINEINEEDEDDFNLEMSKWLRTDLSYDTNWDRFSDRLLQHENSSLSLWKGTYQLASDDGFIHRLHIAAPKTSDSSSKDAAQAKERVYLNGLEVKDYAFDKRTLSWSTPDATVGTTEGKLVFSNLLDYLVKNDITDSANYIDRYCEGKLLSSKGQQSIHVKGKIGVYSYQALRGVYTEGDSLDFWAGEYTLVFANENGENTQGDLIVLPSKNGERNVVKFMGDTIDYEDSTSGSSLTWSLKGENNVVVNNSAAYLTFLQSPTHRKAVTGRILLEASNSGRFRRAKKMEASNSFRSASGMQMKEIRDGHGPLSITSKELKPGKSGETYEQDLEAEGGQKPYKWKIEGLPAGLGGDENGGISGIPTQVGRKRITATVTDASNTSVKDSVFLQIEEGTASTPITSQIQSWVLPIAALLVSITTIIVTALIAKKNRAIEQGKLEAAQDALNEKVEEKVAERTADQTQTIADLERQLEELRENQRQEEIERAEQFEAIDRLRENLIAEHENLARQAEELRQELDRARAEDDQRRAEEVAAEIDDNERRSEEVKDAQEQAEIDQPEEERNGEQEVEPQRVVKE